MNATLLIMLVATAITTRVAWHGRGHVFGASWAFSDQGEWPSEHKNLLAQVTASQIASASAISVC
jgi:hypothetical protein